MAKQTLSAQVAALTSLVEALVSAQAIVAVPRKTEATSPAFGDKSFTAYVASRRAAAIPCELGHGAACNRTFSPKSGGRAVHVARIV